MRQHHSDELIVGPFWVVEPELVIGRTLAAQQLSRAHANGAQELD
jgi:hypothetical protein